MLVLETQSQLNSTKHEEGIFFICAVCKQTKPVQTSGGTGYGYDETGKPICYQCCGERDRKDMIETGSAVLYLKCEPAWYASPKHPGGRRTGGEISNWPGTLKFSCHTRTGHHNIAGTRYDAWFIGPDGYEWHGVMYGEHTQIIRCKRTKTRRTT